MKELTELIEALKRNNISDNTLWNAEDIGIYLRLSKSSIQSRIINQQGFPRAIRLSTVRGRRWQPKEVKEWTLRHREAAL
tara:strand:- start:1104 stop:1343 length:240 start_codon:yes stop_codon:yes gene_type:complete